MQKNPKRWKFPSCGEQREAAMLETIVALTYNSGAIAMTLAPEDAEKFHLLLRAPLRSQSWPVRVARAG